MACNGLNERLTIPGAIVINEANSVLGAAVILCSTGTHDSIQFDFTAGSDQYPLIAEKAAQLRELFRKAAVNFIICSSS